MDLDAAVAAARNDYASKHPVSAEWNERARAVMPGGNTRSVLHFDPFPFRVERAEGKHLHDVDGNRYCDLLGNYTAGLFGHSPEPVLQAARAALDSGWALGSVHLDEVRLAELLTQRFASLEQIRFTNSGTEANLMALAAATTHTGRSKIVVFANGYHGGVITFGAASSPVNVPHHWVVCDFNNAAGVAAAFADHSGDIAAVLVEPMQGSGGCIAGDPDFLGALRSLCSEHGAVLIFDEVMTSRFSTGGAQQVLGITPDMTTLGKYLAGGLTFGAFGGSAEIMTHFDPATGGQLGHAGTFNNNVASMAAGVVAVEQLLRADRLDALHERGDRLRTRLNEHFVSAGLDMCVSGVGSLMNVHGTSGPIASAADLTHSDDRRKELFFFHCLDAGFYIARRGFIALSLEVTDADLDEFMIAVEAFAP